MSRYTVRAAIAALAGAAFLLGLPARSAVAGTHGAGFGGGGTVVLRSGVETLGGDTFGSGAASVAVEPDGRIVVAADETGPGTKGRPAVDLFRLTSAGAPSGFGPSHRPLVLNGCHGTALAVQPDGKLVIACGSYVERLEPTGAPDPGFGDHGLATVTGAGFAALALAPGGKLVVGGAGGILRLLPDGEPDPSFAGGKAAPVPVTFQTLAVDAEGRVLIPAGGPDGSILRYDATGAPDTAFGSAGRAAVPGFPVGVAVRPDGRIVAALNTAIYGQVVAAQLLPDGTLDQSSGKGGISVVSEGHTPGATQPFYSAASAMTLEPDGTVVVAGSGLPSPGSYGYGTWFVQRLRPDGSLAEHAGSPGFFDLDTDCATEVAVAMAAQPDGKIVVVGDACEGGAAKPVLFVTRYTASLADDAGPLLTAPRMRPVVKALGRTVEVLAQLGPSAAWSITARVPAPMRLLRGSSIGSTRLAHPAGAISTHGRLSQPPAIRLLLPRRGLVRHRVYAVQLTFTDVYGKTARSTLHFTAP